jgi:hypothetical protein
LSQKVGPIAEMDSLQERFKDPLAIKNLEDWNERTQNMGEDTELNWF